MKASARPVCSASFQACGAIAGSLLLALTWLMATLTVFCQALILVTRGFEAPASSQRLAQFLWQGLAAVGERRLVCVSPGPGHLRPGGTS